MDGDGEGPRYADCSTVEVEAVVDASVSVVWPLLTDIDLPARFSAEFEGAEWLDGVTGPSAGAKFLCRNEHPVVGSWRTVCTIVDYEPEHRIGYVVNFPDNPADPADSPAAAWRFELEPMSAERVRLRQCARIGPGPSFVEPRHRRPPP